MKLLNIKISLATLLPELVYQFLSTEYVDQNSINCLELEDVREIVAVRQDPEFDDIRKFLEADADAIKIKNEELKKQKEEKAQTNEEKAERVQRMMDVLDAELEEVDSEYYHIYTPGELRYIFGKIIDNIDKFFFLHKKETGENLTLAAGFKLKTGEAVDYEANLVIEFFDAATGAEPLGDVFYIPLEKPLVSDNVAARVYLYYDDQYTPKFEKYFSLIAETLNIKNNGGHTHGPDCGHLH